MQSLNYSESAIATSDTKLAAILLAFGFRLMRPPHPVCQWSYEFASKEDFLRWKQGDKTVPVHEIALWNIAASEGKSMEKARSVAGTYHSGVQAFSELEAELRALDPVRSQRFSALMESFLVQMCRQVLDSRELLVRLLKNRPKEALWIVVRDPHDRKRFSMFGANASAKTIEEHLNIL